MQQDVAPITGTVPDPAKEEDPQRRAGMERSLAYMGLKPNEKLDQVRWQGISAARSRDVTASMVLLQHVCRWLAACVA